jgi:serine phosphatase RsbU (regulator of sigma subunit)
MTGSVSSSDAARAADAHGPIIRSVLLGGLIGALLSVFVATVGQRAVFDTWQRLSPRAIGMDNVAVVLVDDRSVADLGAWPWSRYTMARLMAQIIAARPAAVGVDIYFAEADPLRPEAFASLYGPGEIDPETRDAILALPEWDQVLSSVLGEGDVVLARAATPRDGRDPGELFINSQIDGDPPPGLLGADQVIASIPPLDDNVLSHGMVNGPPDSDGVLRRVPLGVRMGETIVPGFALELARIASGAQRLNWDEDALVIGKRRVFSDEQGRMAFRMGSFPAPAIHSAAAVARGQVAPEAFEGKVVLVGVGATGTFDIVATPLRSEIDGVLVQAMAVDALLEGEWLARPAWIAALEVATALALVALILAAGVTLRTAAVLPAALFALALPIASWLAYTQGNLLFDPVRPLIVGAFAAVALAVTRYALARAERARLAAELLEQRVIASAQEGELKAARRIQMSMVPSQHVLSKLDPRTEIGAVLEPAKSVGGDFYDAARIGENSIIFVVGDVTGKGVPAALFMALSKSLAKSNLGRPTEDLGAAVARLNRDLMDEADEEMGLTLMVGVIDCSTGGVDLVNAGHENPLHVRHGGAIEDVPLRGGPPLCVVDFPYAVERITLAPGDTLVVITDGVTEAANERDELFGMEGVLAALEAVRGQSASHRVAHLAREVRLFEGETDPSDDLTIFALRYLGSRAAGISRQDALSGS